MIDTLQHYPTPPEIAQRAWKMFRTRNVVRLLEPSAGKGDMITPLIAHRWDRPSFAWDAIEIDARHHAALREIGAKVVGFDFLAHGSCAIYSHILMNPPFAQGASHVLHAWDTLFEGEIVAIINAETVRNAFSAERQRLVRLIAEHGRVEFVQDAFRGPGVEREANVEIALVHLEKIADAGAILGDVTKGLNVDRMAANDIQADFGGELAVPSGFVEMTVQAFDLAVSAARDASIAEARASHCRARLGKTMEQLMGDMAGESGDISGTGGVVRKLFAERYAELKNAAWTQILRSSHVLSRLSTRAQKKVESEFQRIMELEFTVANVYGFLHGLVQSSGEIQMDMICEVFDLVTRYHSDNTCFYMGWKSNDRHRSAGMRVKRTRFILPGHSSESWRSGAPYETLRTLADFDKVFAMLDGKSEPAVSLRSVFDNPTTFDELRRGARLKTTYFDVRYYPVRGTIHFFPANMEVIERLNRVVGQHRQWLPPSMADAGDHFRAQYDRAEQFTTEFVEQLVRAGHRTHDTLWGLTSRDADEVARSSTRLTAAMDTVFERHGLDPMGRLGGHSVADPLLLAA